jgi:hypothetical protein
MEQSELKRELNRPQFLIHKINANKTYNLWGRGTGKTNGGLGPRSIRLIDVMEGAQIGLVVPSYVMAKKQIVPNMVGFWQSEMDMVEDVDFALFRKPPDHWQKPIIPVLDYRYVISFSNGSVMPVLSLEAEGPGNGFNLQALLGDEANFFDPRKLKEIIRAIRGCYKQFSHLPEFQSQWYFSDKYGGNIQWMLDKRAFVNDQLIKAVLRMQLHIDQMVRDGADPTAIAAKQQMVDNVRKDLVYVSEASTEENRDILGDKYFEDQKQDSSENEYNIAIRNMDPERVDNPFYQQLASHNFYSTINDVDPASPLIIAPDYQWRVSPIVTAQIQGDKLRFVYSNHTLHPKGLRDAIDEWVHHFRNHPTKTVYYVFDKTAVGKSPNADPYYKTVQERLSYHGWNCVLTYMGEPPAHADKFKTINQLLVGQPGKLSVLINSSTNGDMIKSINLAPAMSYMGQTKKNKASEKKINVSFRK